MGRESVCLNPRSQTTMEGNEVRNLKAFLRAITQGTAAPQPDKQVTLQSEKSDRNHGGCCFLPDRRVHDKVAFSTVHKNDAAHCGLGSAGSVSNANTFPQGSPQANWIQAIPQLRCSSQIILHSLKLKPGEQYGYY